MNQKRNKKRLAKPQFYRGRTTVSGDSVERIRSQKEYRRKKLSKAKRDSQIKFAWKWARVGLVLAFLYVGFLQLRISGSEFVTTRVPLGKGDVEVLDKLTEDFLNQGLNRYKMFFNDGEYQQYLLDNATFLSDASSNVDLIGREITTTVQLKRPIFRFKTPVVINDTTQWVATDGTLMALAKAQLDEFNVPDNPLTIRDEAGLEFADGDSVLSSAEIDFITEVQALLSAELDLQLIEVGLEEGPRDLSLKIDGKKYEVLVSTIRPASVISTEFKLALESIESRGVAVNQYIDLRIKDKVFYK